MMSVNSDGFRTKIAGNFDVYLAQLDCLYAIIKVKRLCKKHHTAFRHNNAHPHVEHHRQIDRKKRMRIARK